MRYVESTGSGVPMRVKPYFVEDLAAGATKTLLAGAAGKYSSIHGIVLSTDAAGQYDILINSEKVFSFHFGANGGIAAPSLWPFYIEGNNQNAAITMNKPAGANTHVTLFAGQA